MPRPPSSAPLGPDVKGAGLSLRPVDYADLSGWHLDDMSAAMAAMKRSCQVFLKLPPTRVIGKNDLAGTARDWVEPCRGIERLNAQDDDAIRRFLEKAFQPYQVLTESGVQDGTFTGYYEAELRAAKKAGGRYRYPIYGKPDDLVMRSSDDAGRMENGRFVPYHTRAEIEAGALKAKAPVLLWTDDPADLFMMHIQGSARVTLEDGSVTRLGVAGHNGHKFRGISKDMADQGLIRDMTAQSMRAWLRANPSQALGIMNRNPRYIFFRTVQAEGAVGALGVPLTPERSLAIDPAFIPLGVPVWLDTQDASGRKLQRLVMAQDTGNAIKGAIRGDFFWGAGESALAQAGKMKSRGRYYILLPRHRANQRADAS